VKSAGQSSAIRYTGKKNTPAEVKRNKKLNDKRKKQNNDRKHLQRKLRNTLGSMETLFS